ncbi:PASTA domain-containing protein [Actinoplanes sp. LDG1-06]|uniref:PASTA domain-containing protein n=1 Tax=Paractinoplanes ovalisporus TaxID=2810368 RepID=A0ABS2AAH1_9ACTN|nr:PASTA domain-containing protein [Actinoplanes ovalisporus]MBM2616830.1 PASTA domain-containing protein [Actinoplanes ovalisporus]
MSDESDETRRFSPGDADDPPPEPKNPGQPAEPEKPSPPAAKKPDPDATQVGGTPADLDATQVGGTPADLDATQVDGTPDDATTVGRAAVPPADDEDTLPGKGKRDDDTLDDVRTVPTIRDEPTVVTDKPGSTAVMPPVSDDDWAPSRANPAWSGRAEVRRPQPGRGYPEVDWAAAAPGRPQRDRWWMPIVVGIVALILLAVLGWAIYLIVQNSSGDESPAPATSTSATPSETVATQTTSPSATPTTTSPEPQPSTTEPSASEITIPALRGLFLADAQEALRSTGLSYRLIYRQAADVPPDTVIDSDPVEGQEVPPDTTVTLVIAIAATDTPTNTTEPTVQPGAGGN